MKFIERKKININTKSENKEKSETLCFVDVRNVKNKLKIKIK